MPNQYLDPNAILAQRIGGSLAQLFAPRDHTKQLQYMVGASQIGENNANAGKLTAETGNLTQVHDGREQAAAAAAAAAGLDPNSPMGQLFGGVMRTMTGANDGSQGFNNLRGGDIIANAANEGEARRGYALTGHDVSKGGALTQDGISQVFTQDTALNDADNATSRANAGTAAGATLGAARIRADASMFGDKLHYGEGGASDRASANVKAAAIYRADHSASKGKVNEVTPSEAAQFTAELARALPPNAQVDGKAMARAGALAAARARVSGDAAGAISEVAQLFEFKPTGRQLLDAKGNSRGEYSVGVFHEPKAAAAPAAPSGEAPPIAGARKAPDGNWYVEKDGKFYPVIN
jgi:hypothetical protein